LAREDTARAAYGLADAVHGAVNRPRVDPLPEATGRQQLDRLDDRRVVHLVHVVLVQEQRVEPVHAPGHRIGGRAIPQPEVRGDHDARDSDPARERHQHQFG
jgi:hypothetical protein